jgi:hypothetical protein
MKTKEEILKMNKEELNNYKWDDDLDKKKDYSYCYSCSYCSNCFNCSNCSYCYDCSDCSDCSDCYNCYNCRNLIKSEYCICNIQLTKEEFEKKKKELIKDENN